MPSTYTHTNSFGTTFTFVASTAPTSGVREAQSVETIVGDITNNGNRSVAVSVQANYQLTVGAQYRVNEVFPVDFTFARSIFGAQKFVVDTNILLRPEYFDIYVFGQKVTAGGLDDDGNYRLDVTYDSDGYSFVRSESSNGAIVRIYPGLDDIYLSPKAAYFAEPDKTKVWGPYVGGYPMIHVDDFSLAFDYDFQTTLTINMNYFPPEIPEAELFTERTDNVDFTSLSDGQKQALEDSANPFQALGGNDVVKLPNDYDWAVMNGFYVYTDLTKFFDAGAGEDFVYGGNLNDVIYGGSGDYRDFLVGGAGQDRLDGGFGVDTLQGGFDGSSDNQTDHLRGGGGDDIIHAYDEDVVYFAGRGDEYVISVNIVGSALLVQTTVTGPDGSDRIMGQVNPTLHFDDNNLNVKLFDLISTLRHTQSIAEIAQEMKAKIDGMQEIKAKADQIRQLIALAENGISEQQQEQAKAIFMGIVEGAPLFGAAKAGGLYKTVSDEMFKLLDGSETGLKLAISGVNLDLESEESVAEVALLAGSLILAGVFLAGAAIPAIIAIGGAGLAFGSTVVNWNKAENIILDKKVELLQWASKLEALDYRQDHLKVGIEGLVQQLYDTRAQFEGWPVVRYPGDLIGMPGQTLQKAIKAINGSYDIKFDGALRDGPIAGATVFADRDGDGVLDVDEPWTMSDASGRFSLPGGGLGSVVAFGGTDVVTGLAFKGQLTAGFGSTVITPYTALMARLEAQGALSSSELVGSAFALSTGAFLQVLDPVSAALDGTAGGARAFVKSVELQSTVILVASAFGGGAAAQAASLEALAAKVIAGGSVDLASASVIDALLTQVSIALGAPLTLEALADIRNTITALNVAFEALLGERGVTLIQKVGAVQWLAQGEVADALAQAAGSPVATAAIAEAYTGANLQLELQTGNPGNRAPWFDSNSTFQTVIFETPSISNSTFVHSANGELLLVDINFDPLVVTFDPGQAAVVWSGAQGQQLQLLQAQINALTQGLVVGQASAGRAAWSYIIEDAKLDFIGDGETVAISAPVTVSDGKGGQATTQLTVTLWGAAEAPVRIDGTPGNDILVGGAGAELFFALGGDDLIRPGGGNDQVDGGAGLDTVAYAAARASAVSLLAGGNINVVGGAAIGDDLLVNVERVQFTDGVLRFDVPFNDDAALVYRIYQASFARTPDEAGYLFWQGVREDQGLSFYEMANYFRTSPEFVQKYGANVVNNDYVYSLYGNVLQRTPDTPGLVFWQGVLNSGYYDRNEMLLAFAESPENVLLTTPNVVDGYWLT